CVLMGSGTGHKYAVLASPFDFKITAGQTHGNTPIRQALAHGADSSRTGGRSAGLREPGAAFPSAQDDVLARDDLGERNVGALRENRVIFEHRTEAAKVVSR